jgi:hydrogenase expression/formation protein HypD
VKYLHEYRQPQMVERLVEKIDFITTRPWTLMEICGGQTHSIVKYGLQQLLPDNITLIHGPGCPVCVTPLGVIDRAIELASQPDIIFCSFGDMLRVPGSDGDLLAARTNGADVRVVYSPLDALQLAEQHPDREVVFLAIGFETTTAANAMAAYQAKQKKRENFSMLVSQFQVPPAIEALCASGQCRVQALLAAGHVCTVMGYHQYPPLAAKFHIPIVVTGFEPVDILDGILCAIKQLEQGEATVENCYRRAVTEAGNIPAQRLIGEVFESSTQEWRGMGIIDDSGFALRGEYRRFDAAVKFGVSNIITLTEASECISGAIMQGLKKPHDCVHFGGRCQPDSPLGAPMVSTEGVCSAYYQFTEGRRA